MPKARKSDSISYASSDFYFNCPKELASHLATLIRLFLYHKFVPEVILLFTLLPLVKDNLGEVTNYRAIAGGGLIMKITDLVVLILEGMKVYYRVFLDCFRCD